MLVVVCPDGNSNARTNTDNVELETTLQELALNLLSDAVLYVRLWISWLDIVKEPHLSKPTWLFGKTGFGC